ncbi:MAG: hypothetical protein HY718_12995 [Planctomycetes bacterium]|nr:hypothetical protein [Planctomycetota bacterium]
MESTTSVNGVPIRLTPERWMHIIEARDELAGRLEEVLAAVESPDWVTRGYRGAMVAWKGYGQKRFLAVVYREISASDGFIVTAFFTSKVRKSNKLWP